MPMLQKDQTLGEGLQQLERELENRFAAKDVASAESPEEAEPLVSIEDFVSCSG